MIRLVLNKVKAKSILEVGQTLEVQMLVAPGVNKKERILTIRGVGAFRNKNSKIGEIKVNKLALNTIMTIMGRVRGKNLTSLR